MLRPFAPLSCLSCASISRVSSLARSVLFLLMTDSRGDDESLVSAGQHSTDQLAGQARPADYGEILTRVLNRQQLVDSAGLDIPSTAMYNAAMYPRKRFR